MHSQTLQKLVEKFSAFPGVGQRTATRFVLYLIKLPKNEFQQLIKALIELKKKVKLCNFCFSPFENYKEKLCQICKDPARDRTLLCIVEKETDLFSLEKTKKYKGLYFILGGAISNFTPKELKKLRFEKLLERIKNPQKFGLLDANFKEILIATNPTTEGETTRLYLEKILKPSKLKITSLGKGLPRGGELEYADEETISFALEAKKEI